MIAIKNLKVNLGDFMLQDINLVVKPGEYFVILGPTGAGKTVLLESIAGLYPVLEGEVWIGDKEVTGLSPEKREIGIVYQDQALFPHLSVEKNIVFGLKIRKFPKNEAKAKTDSIVQIVGISHLLKRSPATLSGGEKQKVALARALVTEPKVLLLDEPLSALDPETREGMQRGLREIHSKIGLTVIHVTHDFEEAVALGHRVAVLNDGRIAQIGTPEEFLRRPSSEFVARFALTRNILSGKVVGTEDYCALVDIGGTKVRAITEAKGEVRLSLRPEDIFISKEPVGSTARNCFLGTVTDIADRGSVIYVTVTLPPDFVCVITHQAFDELQLRKGIRVWITFKASAVHVFKQICKY
ncbi:MAG: ATP-binding cassette domain-containing protein [Dehalococcoidia bacterium]